MMIILLLSWITRQKICKMTTIPPPNMNSFTIITDDSNAILELYSRNYQISDETSQNLVNSIQDKSQGILFEQNLAYKKDVKDNGYIYAFVDISIAKSNFISMLVTAILVAILSILAFLILTILLANWALRPVAQSSSSKSSSWQMLLMNLKPR